MSDQAARFEEWKSVIKVHSPLDCPPTFSHQVHVQGELEQKCARIIAIETELNAEKENNKLMMSRSLALTHPRPSSVGFTVEIMTYFKHGTQCPWPAGAISLHSLPTPQPLPPQATYTGQRDCTAAADQEGTRAGM